MRKWIGKSEGTAPKKKSKLIEKETNIIKVKYETKGLWDVEVQQSADLVWDELQIPDIGQNLEPGEPSLPQEGLYVAIPDDATVTDIKVVKYKKDTHLLSHQVKPAPQPSTDPSALPEITPKQEIYEKDDAFPGILFKKIGVTQVGDVNVVHLMVYPVQYHPIANTIDLYKKIELEVEYELAAEAAPPMRGVPTRGRKRVPAGYEDQILNFDNV
ncbi:MAG: hypothetical protein HWN65_01040 [Candidatus Helarchaeota archaeon]|nr:hypothetical protein [Candidatus Helarchaeota archaeon]NVM54778.1 hypothetical protein [Candidatus Helarchaeota archaeon]